jgi:uncharacterized protein
LAARLKIYFRTETMTCGQGEGHQDFLVSDLMPAGSTLVALQGDDQGAASRDDKAAEGCRLVAGDFVEMTADQRALVAIVQGYPHLIRVKEGEGEQVRVDVEPLVAASADGWTAKLTLYPPLAGSALPEPAEILSLLDQAEIRWGVREKNIAACIQAVNTEQRPQKQQVIARGRPPIPGENGWLRIGVEIGAQAGKEMGDGRMDYRERRLFIGVDKGQLLATKVPATAGIPGINIYGQEVAQVPGRVLTIKTGEDVLYDAETGEIRAAFAGVLSVVTNTGVKVTAKHVLSGDIDFNTGNIDSGNAVEIGGSVKPGFKVVTGGDLLIGGSVESAHVLSHGNVVIRGGMMGKEASLEADGDVDIPVVDNGSVSSKGSVRISREVYHAEIKSLADISCTGQAKVVSCELFAGGSITVNDVDTDTSPNSLLAAATLPERYVRHQKLLKAYHQAQAAVEAWYRRFGGSGAHTQLVELQEELADAQASLASYNLVPVVGEHNRADGLRYACCQRITVQGTVRAGAVIRIGNSETTLKKNFHEGYFALNGETGKLQFHTTSKGLCAATVEPL